MIYVRDGKVDDDIPITEASHLQKGIFNDPAAFLSPVRVYLSPEMHNNVRGRMDSIIKEAEDRFYNPQDYKKKWKLARTMEKRELYFGISKHR